MSWLDSFRRRSPEPAAKVEEELFDEEFQRKLDSLVMVSRKVFAGRARAERRSKKSGSGIEFADHRDYTAGDDFRYVDFNVYRRFGRLLVRLYEEEEDLSIYFVVDASASMGFGGGRKLRYAKQLAAALAYIGLANLDRIGIVATSSRIVERMPPVRGKGQIFKVFHFLRGLSAGGTTKLKDALDAFVAQNKRRGLVVLISDLYDPEGFERALDVLRYAKFEVFVLHVIDREDGSPKLLGDVRLDDCETGMSREVTVTPKLLDKLRESYEAYLHDVQRYCAERQMTYVPADVSVPFDELILRVLRQGGFLR